MRKPIIKYQDVSIETYEALLAFMEEKDGVTVTRKNINGEIKSSVTGDNTEINGTYYPDSNILEIEFAKVPAGLGTYYWGHLYQRVYLLSKNLFK